ncbi:MAG: orotate phosphoribosyltransferase [bacterium]|nr:orotate phosphoribosyltransferase [bacterium]
MSAYKEQFIEFMLDAGVLTFGDFTTKSGRKTPYFVNTGRYRTGEQIAQLGRFYAASITDRLGADFDVLFGPAYKGIPLVITTASKLFEEHGLDRDWCFNRKEVKDHGEGGSLVGRKLEDGDRVLIVEDVTTAGTAIREAVPLLRAAADVRLAGLIVSVDRQERGTGDKAALTELAEAYEMPTFAIVTLDEIVTYLRGREIAGSVLLDDEQMQRIEAYRAEYGAR